MATEMNSTGNQIIKTGAKIPYHSGNNRSIVHVQLWVY